MSPRKPLQAIPLVVNRVLNKAGLRDEVAGMTRLDGTHVVAFGPRAQAGEAADLLVEAEKALLVAGYAVEWVVHEGANNSYLVVKEGGGRRRALCNAD